MGAGVKVFVDDGIDVALALLGVEVEVYEGAAVD
jgi:hypothetical protein